jgi:hypothetical protein
MAALTPRDPARRRALGLGGSSPAPRSTRSSSRRIRDRFGVATARGIDLRDGASNWSSQSVGAPVPRCRLAPSLENYESFFRPPAQVGNPDAVQYTPVYNDVSAWQLYHGPGFWRRSPPARPVVTIRVAVALAGARSRRRPRRAGARDRGAEDAAGVGAVGILVGGPASTWRACLRRRSGFASPPSPSAARSDRALGGVRSVPERRPRRRRCWTPASSRSTWRTLEAEPRASSTPPDDGDRGRPQHRACSRRSRRSAPDAQAHVRIQRPRRRLPQRPSPTAATLPRTRDTASRQHRPLGRLYLPSRPERTIRHRCLQTSAAGR